MDFKMADDIQKIQQLIGLNAQRKVSDETLLTELGLDYEQETKKIVDEMKVQNDLQIETMKSSAKASGESQLVSYEYQARLQSMQTKDMQNQPPGEGGEEAQQPGQEGQQGDTQAGQQPQEAQGAEQGAPAEGQEGEGGQGADQTFDINKKAGEWANKLTQMERGPALQTLGDIKMQMPSFGKLVEDAYNLAVSGVDDPSGAGAVGPAAQAGASSPNVNMTPMPTQRAPTRAGSA